MMQELRAAWTRRANPLVRDIVGAVSSGEFLTARDAAQSLTLEGIVEAKRNRLDELGISALLQGAGQVSDLGQTGLVQGRETLEQARQDSLDQLERILRDEATPFVRNAVLQLIAEAQSADRSEVGPVRNSIAKAESLEDRIRQTALDAGRNMTDIGANLTASRLASMGFLVEAQRKNITRYQVSEVLDTRICPVCRYMHGKEFEVEEALQRLPRVLQTEDPKELEQLAPWPGQSQSALDRLYSMSPSDLQNAGLDTPPYHPRCRGILKRAGTESELIPTGTRVREQDREPAPEQPPDFADLSGQGTEQFQDWRRRFYSGERPGEADTVIEKYVGGQHAAINRHLRGTPIRRDDEFDAFIRARLAEMDRLVETGSLPQNTRLYRAATSLTQVHGDEIAEGERFADAAFVSASLDAGVALAALGSAGVLVEILAEKGAKAAPGDTEQREVILDRGQSFRVVEVTQTADGRTKLVIEQLDQQKAIRKQFEDVIAGVAAEDNRFLWRKGQVQILPS